MVLITNASAQVALRTLRSAETSLQQTQFRVADGLKVASADDNPAFFLVANTQRSDIVKIDGIRENLNYALGAVRSAQSAQGTLNQSIQNIRDALVQLEVGVGRDGLEKVIEQQIEEINKALLDTSFNGINLLAERQTISLQSGIERSTTGDLRLQEFSIQGAGLAVRSEPVNALAPPVPGFTLDFNDGGNGGLAGTTIPSTPNVNTLPGNPGFDEKTFGVAFETGADINNLQVIYEEGGAVRGLNISVEGGQLRFGIYNAPTDGGGGNWGYTEVQAPIEANTRYTAQLVMDGTFARTGELRAYVNGQLYDTAGGVGLLYNHGDPNAIGEINNDAVIGGTQYQNQPAGTFAFQGAIDKVVLYNDVLSGPEFDQVTTYLAEDWLPDRKIQYYVGSQARKDSATLVELLEAIIPIDQDGFSVAGALEVVDAAQQKIDRAFAEIGFFEDRILRQQDYLYGLSNSIEEGVASLVEADLAEESAKLRSFQVQTELARQSLVVSNSRPSLLLQLFS